MEGDRHRVRLLVVDDHASFRRGIRALIAPEEDLEIVGEAASVAATLDAVSLLQPDVLLLDLFLGEENALNAMPEVRTRAPDCAALVHSGLTEPASVVAAFSAGARGYVFKDDDEAVVVKAIRAVSKGECHLPISNGLFHATARCLGLPDASTNVLEQLTAREREVLRYLRRGFSSKETAVQLNVGEKAIERHRANIRDKCEISEHEFGQLLRSRN